MESCIGELYFQVIQLPWLSTQTIKQALRKQRVEAAICRYSSK